MTHVRLELGPSATYTRRVALWVPSVGTGDGALVLTVYVPKQMPHSSCYWVEVTDDKVMVWDGGGGSRKRHYTVTAEKCSCNGMRKYGSKPCKHKSAVDQLVASGHIKVSRPAINHKG